MRVVLVEDDDGVASAVEGALRTHRIRVDRVSRGSDALGYVTTCDVVVLDLGLPDADGIDVCRALRQSSDVPILVATARGTVRDRVLGLNVGADDYLVKPFDIDELVARLRALVRRRSVRAVPAAQPVVVDGIAIDLDRACVRVDGREVALGAKEYGLLAAIASAGGSVCTRKRLVAEVWGRWWSGADRTLDVTVGSLRRKLGRRRVVETVRGIGYRLAGAGPMEDAG